jgi:hypothetical protein
MATVGEAMADIKRDDWAATEYIIEVLDDIRKRLRAGAQGPGTTLDADQCAKTLACLVNPAFPNSRPPGDGVRDYGIDLFCARLEQRMPLKNAIIDTAEHFGCSISTVRSVLKAARK